MGTLTGRTTLEAPDGGAPGNGRPDSVTAAWGTAVVIGGSVAGSFAARVLHDHFERVIVFDRDDLPDAPVARKGAPQGVHFHALLARGRQVAEELFPGFVDELLADGAAPVHLRDSLVYEPYGWAPTGSSTRSHVGASRLLIEAVVRRRVGGLRRVEVRPRTEVLGLVATSDGARVTGVRVRRRGRPASASPVADERADLVVDASGRTSPAVSWLEGLGRPEPATTVVNAHWGYASRFYRFPDGVVPPVVGGFPIGAASDGPPATRGGFLLKQERDLWLVTLSGCAGDFPPGDEAGFAAFARTLAFPHIGEAIPQGEPLSPIRTWRNTANRLRHVEQVPAWPEAFVCLSDAVCSFNPVYGQGMTVAALEALDLRAELEAQRAGRDRTGRRAGRRTAGGELTGLGGRFQRRLAGTVTQAWEAACRSDFRVPGVRGAAPPDGFLERLAFHDRVVALGRDDPSVYERIGATNQLVIGPEWLDEPELRARVLAEWDRLGALVGCRAPIPA
jgi:2-polyprenyl-6-methoxyphenol hydroxylase-like FAD-dependent oxidoreductase